MGIYRIQCLCDWLLVLAGSSAKELEFQGLHSAAHQVTHSLDNMRLAFLKRLTTLLRCVIIDRADHWTYSFPFVSLLQDLYFRFSFFSFTPIIEAGQRKTNASHNYIILRLLE